MALRSSGRLRREGQSRSGRPKRKISQSLISLAQYGNKFVVRRCVRQDLVRENERQLLRVSSLFIATSMSAALTFVHRIP
jgi:hypothetical protein